jgi:hypothetical protein
MNVREWASFGRVPHRDLVAVCRDETEVPQHLRRHAMQVSVPPWMVVIITKGTRDFILVHYLPFGITVVRR